MDMLSPQELFATRYITSTEVCQRLQISRTTLHHKRASGKLPGAIGLPGQTGVVWERDTIEPFLVTWEIARGLKQETHA